MSFAPEREQAAFARRPSRSLQSLDWPRPPDHRQRRHRARVACLSGLRRGGGHGFRGHAADAGCARGALDAGVSRESRMSAPSLPDRFDSVAALEDFITEPGPELSADLAGLPGDILVLGVAGKMGPTLARMAKRAAPRKARRRRGALLGSGACARAWRRRASRPSPAICSIARAVEALPKLAQRRLHGGHEVRRVRQSGADLGHERARAGHRRRGVRGLAHRRLLHGMRLPVRAR